MKSLEHIIREIREGKTEKGSKKTLEGSIRKVMKGEKESSFADRTTKPIADDVGGLTGSGTGGEPKLHAEAIGVIGTDDYKGNQFKSVRTQTPHIKPPAGPGSHSQAPENVSRQRTLAKERQSMTLHGKVTEEKIDEVAPAIAALASPYIAPMLGATAAGVAGYLATRGKGKLPSFSSYDPEKAKQNDSYSTAAGRMKTMKFDPAKPVEAPKPDEARPAAPTEPAPVTPVPAKPKEKPAEPAKAPEKPAEETPKAPPITVPAPAKPEAVPAQAPAKAIPVPKTPEIDLPAPAPALVKPASATQTAAATATAVDAGTQTKTDTAPATKTAAQTATATNTETETKDNEKKKFSFPGGSSVGHNYAYDAMHGIHNKVNIHKAMKHRMHEDTKSREEIENMPRKGQRKTIEYVGRKDSDPKTTKEKTSRLAIIKNVIDEAKKEIAVKKQSSFEDGKTKVFDYGKDLLVVNPNQRRLDLDVDSGEKIPKDYDNK